MYLYVNQLSVVPTMPFAFNFIASPLVAVGVVIDLSISISEPVFIFVLLVSIVSSFFITLPFSLSYSLYLSRSLFAVLDLSYACLWRLKNHQSADFNSVSVVLVADIMGFFYIKQKSEVFKLHFMCLNFRFVLPRPRRFREVWGCIRSL